MPKIDHHATAQRVRQIGSGRLLPDKLAFLADPPFLAVVEDPSGSRLQTRIEIPSKAATAALAKAVPLGISVVAQGRRKLSASPPWRHSIKGREASLVPWNTLVVYPMRFTVLGQRVDQNHCVRRSKRVPFIEKLATVTRALFPEDPPSIFKKPWIRMQTAGVAITQAIIYRLLLQCVKAGNLHCSPSSSPDPMVVLPRNYWVSISFNS